MTGWHRHNGQPVPYLSGKPLLVRLDMGGGDVDVCPCTVKRGRGASWLWRKGYARVLAYKILPPDGAASGRIASAPRSVDNAGKEMEDV